MSNPKPTGGRPEKWPIEPLVVALVEARGEVAEAARLVTAEAIRQSDRAELKRRARLKDKTPETPEERTARHKACTLQRRQLAQYVQRHPELQEARAEGKRGFLVECEDVLHAAVREKVTKRIVAPDGGEAFVMVNQPTPLAVRTSMFMLDRRHPDYRRSVHVTQNATADPLDLGALPESEQRRLAGDDPEEGGDS